MSHDIQSHPHPHPSADIELPSPPTDGITHLAYGYTGLSNHSSDELLAVSSWDKTLRLYSTSSSSSSRGTYKPVSTIQHHSSVLSFTYNTHHENHDRSDQIYTGQLNGQVQSIDLHTLQSTVIHHNHVSGVKCMKYSSEHHLLLSAGWDGQLIAVDTRMQSNGQRNVILPTYQMSNPSKVYAMDINPSPPSSSHTHTHVHRSSPKNRIVLGLCNRQVYIYDIRKLEQPEQVRESSLINQTRSIACMPSGEGYVLTSIEGRISVEWYDPSDDVQLQKYAFKCHRQTKQTVSPTTGLEESTTYVYPVNVVLFHPIYHTFSSGGGDGQINVWDLHAKKRICQYPPYRTSIASLAYDRRGEHLAIAVSYMYEEGEKSEVPPDAVYIRKVNDHEVRPKALK